MLISLSLVIFATASFTPVVLAAPDASFGSCSTPQIKFAQGLDGRTETAFAPVDQNSFPHGSDDNIDTISSFICQQLQDKCQAPPSAVSTCQSASSAADKVPVGTGAQADAFNAAFGQKTNFASVSVVNSAGQTQSSSTATSTSQAGGTSSSDDVQSATVLAPQVIATGFEQDGQATPTAGQVASLTSKNNFINFCLTVNKPITNGQQITTGSCNPAPMGVIASVSNMPSSKFTNPKNGATIKANQDFTVSMAINHLETGNFVNANTNYYSAPQQVNGAGDIIGHSHFVIQQLQSLDQDSPLDPGTFAFFKGVNDAAVNGVVSVDVTGGLPAGEYRIASINSAANHQPVLVAIAQHGSLDDMAYFTVQ